MYGHDARTWLLYVPGLQETAIHGSLTLNLSRHTAWPVCTPKAAGNTVADTLNEHNHLLMLLPCPFPYLCGKILIVSLGSLAASTPSLAAILMAIIGVWITSAKSLGGMIKKFEAEEDAIFVDGQPVKPKLVTSAQ